MPGPPSATLPMSMRSTRWKVSFSMMRAWYAKSLRTRSSSWSWICWARLSRSTPSRVKTCTSITVPFISLGSRNEVSFTSDAFSPNIARSNFSSAVSWVSPMGVTLPTRMSPARTWAPM
jgi:hypothetical protein